ncbi:hypothetical protein [Aureispira anguillae]|uniref:Uncharacterized protein n=1 Tax=Aureispira anguillae TaxID=2864201 RepID=A0A915YBM4_9BACT|nr:hypothetical protein [Aureispira anguillae]BDS10100.1 hypothetical protein AsAng_0008070 [Aureispira anguillae]
MTAFANPDTSLLINTQPEISTIKTKEGTPGVSSSQYQIPDSCLPKSYDNTGRYVQFVGAIKALSEGKKITIRLKVNGELKSERVYESAGFICDPANDKTPPQANVKGGDLVSVEISTDDIIEQSVLNSVFYTYAGKTTTEFC